MSYGICTLSIVPLQGLDQHNSPVLSEVLYGEIFQILKAKKRFSQVRLSDNTTGWIENSQFAKISEADYNNLSKKPPKNPANLVKFTYKNDQIPFTMPIERKLEHTS